MERIIQSHNPDKKITVINAGICGSDPIFGYKDYDSIFYKYSPDIVVQSLDELDFFDDIASRGGFERFASDGKVYFANSYKYGKVYKWLFLSRIYFNHICGLNILFLNHHIVELKKPFFEEQVCLLATKWDDQIRKRKFKMYFVLRPNRSEINRNGYDPIFASIVTKLRKCSHEANVVDLTPFFIDSTTMGKNPEIYFWKQDGHNNSLGYYQMARAIANAIKL